MERKRRKKLICALSRRWSQISTQLLQRGAPRRCLCASSSELEKKRMKQIVGPTPRSVSRAVGISTAPTPANERV